MIYDELIEELALTLLIKARYEGCISVIDGYKEWWDTKKKLMWSIKLLLQMIVRVG